MGNSVKKMRMIISGLLTIAVLFSTYSSSTSSNFKENVIVAGIIGFPVIALIANKYWYEASRNTIDQSHKYDALENIRTEFELLDGLDTLKITDDQKAKFEQSFNEFIRQYYSDNPDVISLQAQQK